MMKYNTLLDLAKAKDTAKVWDYIDTNCYIN